MRHDWLDIRYGTREYETALAYVIAHPDPEITHYPDTDAETPFAMGLEGGYEVSVDIYHFCRHCGSVMLSDPGGDYVAVIGEGDYDYYECP